jgi:transcriptional regulator with XRE-family HTH domain
MMNFGKSIESCLLANGWTKQHLADLASIPREEVSRIVAGKRNISFRIAEEIASALGYPLWEMISPGFRPRQKVA